MNKQQGLHRDSHAERLSREAPDIFLARLVFTMTSKSAEPAWKSHRLLQEALAEICPDTVIGSAKCTLLAGPDVHQRRAFKGRRRVYRVELFKTSDDGSTWFDQVVHVQGYRAAMATAKALASTGNGVVKLRRQNGSEKIVSCDPEPIIN